MLAAALMLSGLPLAWAQVPEQPGGMIDPPGTVARLNLAQGAVSYAPAEAAGPTGNQGWTPAELNRPLTSGDRLWTGRQARAELHIGSTAVRLSEQTSLDFLALDDDTTQLRLAQGTIRLRVRALFAGQRLEVNTPNLAFVISKPGDYRIDATPATNVNAGITRVVVQSGAGVIYGDGAAQVNLGKQQQASFSGTQLTPAGPGAATADSFDLWALERDRREDQSVSARYIPRETIGYQQLDSHGDWRQDPTYGAVWLPRAVPVNWAPYRVGHWSWISPWGWTWVDDAPWGFAPFHYGRWAQIGPRWGWVPGRLAPRPVYAPALVAFVGGQSGGVNWNIALGQASSPQPGLGWFPLAPDEAFRPSYRVSPRYVDNVNHNIVVNNNVTNVYRYQRQPEAVTAVSALDFARGHRVRGNLHDLSADDLGRAQLLSDRNAIPQRPMLRDLPRPVAAAALPPAAVVARPVVASQAAQAGRREDRREERREERRDEFREGRPGERAGERRQQAQDAARVQPDPADAQRAGRPDGNGRNREAQAPVPVAPAVATPAPGLPGAQPSALSAPPAAVPRGFSGATPDRSAIDAEQRARREQQQLQQNRQQDQAQRDQQRQQPDLARQQQGRPDVLRQPGEDALGQRAMREQAQKNAPVPLPVNPPAPINPEARAAAERTPVAQAQRTQQQRQQVDLARQQEQQGKEQQARQQQQDQQRQQQAQQQQQLQQRAQQDQQRQAREQQQDQARQQQDQARQQQAQQRAQQDQQRQAREQQQQQRAQQAQPPQAREQQQQRPVEAANARTPRSDDGPNRKREASQQ